LAYFSDVALLVIYFIKKMKNCFSCNFFFFGGGVTWHIDLPKRGMSSEKRGKVITEKGERKPEKRENNPRNGSKLSEKGESNQRREKE
jgi:hypothetical protein